MSQDPLPPSGEVPRERPQVGELLRDVRGAVRQSSRREPYPLLAASAAGLTALWLLWPEGGAIGAAGLKLWTLFVLCSVGLLFVPMCRERLRLEPDQAWRLAAGGAGGLGFAWVAFLLPSISSNQAFFGTLATAAGALAVWTAPGRPQ
jgi:hypothetical protein